VSGQPVPIRVGDLFRIDLPNRRFAFGCVLRDASVGIYPGTFTSPTPPDGLAERRFAFTEGIYSDILPSGVCPLVGHREFVSDDDEWPPPTCHLDLQSKTASIYYKGRFTPCEPKDVVGLVCELEHIIERIVRTQPEVQ
jgi:hypothetical protein